MDGYGGFNYQNAQHESSEFAEEEVEFETETREKGGRGNLPDIDVDFYMGSQQPQHHKSRSTNPSSDRSLRERLHITHRGSLDKIGWLASEEPTPEDQTQRFAILLGQIRKKTHGLRRNLPILLIPGLFSNFASAYFHDTLEHFSELGVHCEIAKIESQVYILTYFALAIACFFDRRAEGRPRRTMSIPKTKSCYINFVLTGLRHFESLELV